jgi:hypothetical protein
VIANGDTALAQAAKPALGEAGFVMMAIAALLAISSSVNANICAATGSTAKLAETGMFPPLFGQLARVGGTRGLVISVVAVLLLANFVDLTAIASLGSAVALSIFLINSIGAYRLEAETASRTPVLIAGIGAHSRCTSGLRRPNATNRALDLRRDDRHRWPCHHPRRHLEPHSRTACCGRLLTETPPRRSSLAPDPPGDR